MSLTWEYQCSGKLEKKFFIRKKIFTSVFVGVALKVVGVLALELGGGYPHQSVSCYTQIDNSIKIMVYTI